MFDHVHLAHIVNSAPRSTQHDFGLTSRSPRLAIVSVVQLVLTFAADFTAWYLQCSSPVPGPIDKPPRQDGIFGYMTAQALSGTFQ